MRCGSSRIFVVAGEASGDALGAAMISSIRHRSEAAVLFNGVGGSAPTAVELQNELSRMSFGLPVGLQLANGGPGLALAVPNGGDQRDGPFGSAHFTAANRRTRAPAPKAAS